MSAEQSPGPVPTAGPAPQIPAALRDPVTAALHGPDARFRVQSGRIARYHPQVAGFFAHPREFTGRDWSDTAALAADGDGIALLRDRASPLPDGARLLRTVELRQFSGAGLDTAEDPAAEPLTGADVAQMAALIARTKPGPFLPRTIELGGYLGIRDHGRIVAMAGERMHPRGWTEISAVCTAPQARGRGLATRLIRAVGAAIAARGDVPFLHTGGDNPAQRLYRDLGFTLISTVPLEIVRFAGDTVEP